jgi:predicted RNA-binding Zn-ribbon protein involved in translation (DUF1610 family)
MFCSSCGEKIEEGVNFCPHCGAAQTQISNRKQGRKNSVISTTSKTFKGGIFKGITSVDKINEYLRSDNFGYVRWSFTVSDSIVRSITLTCDVMEDAVPYYFAIDLEMSPFSIIGALGSSLTRWKTEKAVNKWVEANPDAKLRNTRPIHDHGVDYAVFILYTRLKN